MGRRGENIRKRKDGRWEARLVVGSPVNGKTNYKFIYAKTYRDAKRLKEEYYLELKTGKHKRHYGKLKSVKFNSKSNINEVRSIEKEVSKETLPVLFKVAANGWLADKKSSVKESSYSYYAVMIKNHIIPDLGDLPLSEVTTQKLSNFFIEKKACGGIREGQPLKDKTVADIRAIVRQILIWANKNNMQKQTPICPKLSVRQKATEVLTIQEQSMLEAQLIKEDTPFCLGVWLSLYGGLRIGEACALKWENVDFINGTVYINKTVNRIIDASSGIPSGTKVIVSSPKTECSLRTIPLPDAIMSYLKGRKRPGERYVMTGTNQFLEPKASLPKFKRLLKRAGVKEYTWHALRHTFATRCIENGVDVKSLSEIMGHSDVKITMQRYVHPSMDAKKNQVNKLTCKSINLE